jgi:hypothetical protein
MRCERVSLCSGEEKSDVGMEMEKRIPATKKHRGNLFRTIKCGAILHVFASTSCATWLNSTKGSTTSGVRESTASTSVDCVARALASAASAEACDGEKKMETERKDGWMSAKRERKERRVASPQAPTDEMKTDSRRNALYTVYSGRVYT